MRSKDTWKKFTHCFTTHSYHTMSTSNGSLLEDVSFLVAPIRRLNFLTSTAYAIHLKSSHDCEGRKRKNYLFT